MFEIIFGTKYELYACGFALGVKITAQAAQHFVQPTKLHEVMKADQSIIKLQTERSWGQYNLELDQQDFQKSFLILFCNTYGKYTGIALNETGEPIHPYIPNSNQKSFRAKEGTILDTVLFC